MNSEHHKICIPNCGDDIIVEGEECDDANSLPGDGCSEECKIEFGFTCNGIPFTEPTDDTMGDSTGDSTGDTTGDSAKSWDAGASYGDLAGASLGSLVGAQYGALPIVPASNGDSGNRRNLNLVIPEAVLPPEPVDPAPGGGGIVLSYKQTNFDTNV